MAAPLAGAARTEWARRLQRAPAVALFSDFDGTLSRIVPRATQARLPVSTRDLLRQLARRRDVFVALVSGRPVAELRRLVRLSGLGYIGVHGIETAWPGQRVVSRASQQHRAAVAEARAALEHSLGTIRGLWIEDKGVSVAVHFRKAPAWAAPRIERDVAAVARRFARRLKLGRGKKVLELMPALEVSKATAVFEMRGELPRRLGAAPTLIYLGDDRTDETVFRRLRTSDLGIHVGRPGARGAEGPARTAARYWLADSAAVREFLRELLALCARR